jgi:hypothetical protein
MKRFVLVIGILICGTLAAFALEETWMSMGFEFGNSVEHYDDKTTYIGSPGFNFNAYGFFDKKDVGLFFHYGFLVPVAASGDGDIEDYGFQMDFLVGPGFRYSFNDNLKLQFGIGVDWIPIFSGYTKDDKDYTGLLYNLGIGADVGIKYDMTDFFYLSGGVTLSYMFYNHTTLYSYKTTSNNETIQTQEIDKNIKGYGMFTAKPYIAIGFNYYQEKAVRGKPKS